MTNKSGITELNELIKNMEPELIEGEFVFVTVDNVDAIPRSIPICEIKEREGITLVLPKVEAENLGLDFDFIAAMITLNVHSSLEAVGLTAAFATALGNHNISCNVIAGFYHDHIFVDVKDRAVAMSVLRQMTIDAN